MNLAIMGHTPQGWYSTQSQVGDLENLYPDVCVDGLEKGSILMDTHCQTAIRSGSSECQKLGVVNSFWGKMRGGQLQFENILQGQ